MKKTIILILCILMAVICSSCSAVVNIVNNAVSEIPVYISDYDAQFNDTDNQVLITFGLMNDKKKYISSSGTAKVVITDKTGNKLYDDTISFSEKDFADYTSKLWTGVHYLCGIYIDADNITPAANDDGIVELTVTAANEKSIFDTQKTNIFDLPTKDIDIKTPKLPKKVIYIDFDNNKTVVKVTDVSIESKIISDLASAEVNVTLKMIDNNTDSSFDYITIGYTLKNSKDVIVDSGEEYVEYINEGEATNIDFELFDLDPNESYKLSFKDIDESY